MKVEINITIPEENRTTFLFWKTDEAEITTELGFPLKLTLQDIKNELYGKQYEGEKENLFKAIKATSTYIAKNLFDIYRKLLSFKKETPTPEDFFKHHFKDYNDISVAILKQYGYGYILDKLKPKPRDSERFTYATMNLLLYDYRNTEKDYPLETYLSESRPGTTWKENDLTWYFGEQLKTLKIKPYKLYNYHRDDMLRQIYKHKRRLKLATFQEFLNINPIEEWTERQQLESAFETFTEGKLKFADLGINPIYKTSGKYTRQHMLNQIRNADSENS